MQCTFSRTIFYGAETDTRPRPFKEGTGIVGTEGKKRVEVKSAMAGPFANLYLNGHGKQLLGTTMSLILKELREYIHLPDPTPLYCTLAAVVANKFSGQGLPAFSFMLLGPAGCGGTLMTELLLKTKGVHSVSKFSAESMLSGTPMKEMKKTGSKGGLLKLWGDGDTVVIKDFTTVLSMRPDAKMEALGVLRDVSDGHYERGVGSDGGKLLKWAGKIGIVSKCTLEFDKHYSAITTMGDRFLYYRYPMDTKDADKYASYKAIEVLGWDMDHARELVAVAIEEAVAKQGEVEVKRGRANAIIMIAKMCARARADVTRDRFNKEIMSVGQPERSMRLSKALTLMYLALRALGLGEEITWGVVKEVGLSTMPEGRGMVVRDMMRALMPKAVGGEGKGYVTIEDLTERYGFGRGNMVRMAVEDLMVHGVVERLGVEGKEERERGKKEKGGGGGDGRGRSKVKYGFTETAKEWWMKGWVE